jgi:Uma2 family endonuclease
MSTLVPRYTAEELRRFPDDHLRYEVIRGELVVTPAPGTAHQRAVLELARRLQEYLKRHVIGEALPAPFEVEFTEDSAVQPDILVILDPQRDRLTAARLYGPPALIVEVVSYSSKRTDRLHKRRLYSEEGVPEYWIVDTEARHIERWRPGATSAGDNHLLLPRWDSRSSPLSTSVERGTGGEVDSACPPSVCSASELVNWFNTVDATYRADLRELNELNFARSDAKLEQRLAELRSSVAERLAELESRLTWRMFAFWVPTALAVIGTGAGVVSLLLRR